MASFDPTPASSARSNVPYAILAGALVIAATLALTRTREGARPTPERIAAAPADSTPAPATPALPAGHPPLNGQSAPTGMGGVNGMAGMGGMPGMGGEPVQAGVRWTTPARWQLVPSTNSMRIATYRIPHAPGDAEDAELAVTRAGGDTEANIGRWLGQFDPVGRQTVKRSEKTVAGMKVSLVDIAGDFTGMDSPEPQPGFAMSSAIVDTPGTKHFFKMVGPARTVRAAAGEFQAVVDSLTPIAP